MILVFTFFDFNSSFFKKLLYKCKSATEIEIIQTIPVRDPLQLSYAKKSCKNIEIQSKNLKEKKRLRLACEFLHLTSVSS